MDDKDLLNWSSLSIVITGNSESIRRNRIPAKYEKQVQIFQSAISKAKDDLRRYEISKQ